MYDGWKTTQDHKVQLIWCIMLILVFLYINNKNKILNSSSEVKKNWVV